MSLLSDLNKFNKSNLKQTKTIVKTQDGREFVESKVGGRYEQQDQHNTEFCGWVVDNKPDLQVAKIIEHLYLGSQDVAARADLLINHNISHILTLVPNIEPMFPDIFQYKVLPVLDIPEFVFMTLFEETFTFIEECLKNKNSIFVHCNAGLSRAPTAVAAYLIKSKNLTCEEAISLIKEVRTHANPNKGFVKQLQLYEQQCHQF